MTMKDEEDKLKLRWRKLLDESSDAEVLSTLEQFERLKESQPLIYEFLKPEFEKRKQKARQSS